MDQAPPTLEVCLRGVSVSFALALSLILKCCFVVVFVGTRAEENYLLNFIRRLFSPSECDLLGFLVSMWRRVSAQLRAAQEATAAADELASRASVPQSRKGRWRRFKKKQAQSSPTSSAATAVELPGDMALSDSATEPALDTTWRSMFFQFYAHLTALCDSSKYPNLQA